MKRTTTTHLSSNHPYGFAYSFHSFDDVILSHVVNHAYYQLLGHLIIIIISIIIIIVIIIIISSS